MRTLRGTPEGAGRRVAIVAARFNELVVTRLVDGAIAALSGHGVDDDHVDLAWVPGAFELPIAARAMAASGRYDAVVCLGAVIRGETAHFDHVAGQAAAGIREAGVATGVPVIFGVLTTDDLGQAMDRAGGRHGNKGWDAALSALETCSVLERIGKREGGDAP